MLDDGMLLMNDAFKSRVDTDISDNFTIRIFNGEKELLKGTFVSLATGCNTNATLVFTTKHFWPSIDLSKNINEYSNLYITMNDIIINSAATNNWYAITVERLGQSARVTLSNHATQDGDINV